MGITFPFADKYQHRFRRCRSVSFLPRSKTALGVFATWKKSFQEDELLCAFCQYMTPTLADSAFQFRLYHVWVVN
jgi:hypothetical protein